MCDRWVEYGAPDKSVDPERLRSAVAGWRQKAFELLVELHTQRRAQARQAAEAKSRLEEVRRLDQAFVCPIG